MTTRRGAIAGALAVAVAGPTAFAQGGGGMYGMIGRMTAKAGQHGALIALLLEGTAAMPGCLSYVVAEDSATPDAIWVSEAWDSSASHQASLAIPAVRAAIAKARPLLAESETVATTRPVGGVGLQ